MATGSAQDEQGLPKDEVQQLRSEFQLVVEQGQASMMLAMRDMISELMRNKGRSESSSAGSSTAGREGPRGLNLLLYELLLLLEAWQEIQQQEERQLCMGMPHAISERRDAERLPFLSRWAQPGASQTSQGGLANAMHPQAVSWVVVLICLSRAIWPISTTQHQYLVA